MIRPADQYVSQTVSTPGPLLAWLLLSLGAVVVLGLIVGAPLALAGNHWSIALVIYKDFSRVCHQLPERSFYVAGFPLAVCSRCTGLYAGFSAALLSYPLLRSLKSTDTPHRRWFFLAAVPLAIDFGLTFTGIWQNTHSSRFLTGALLGAVAVFYVMPGVAELALRWRRPNSLNSFPSLNSSPVASPLPAGPSDYSSPNRRI